MTETATEPTATEPTATEPTATEAAADKPLFTDIEIEQFDADDVVAGTAIGKMLSILFLYTVLAMSLVTWWTFRMVGNQTDDSGEVAAAAEEGGGNAAGHGEGH